MAGFTLHSTKFHRCGTFVRRWPRSFLIAILLVFPVVFISLSYFEDIAETRGLFPTSDLGRGVAAWLVSLAASVSSRAIGFATETGYAGIFLLMLLEAAAFPVPSEILLPFAGYLVSQGIFSFWLVVIYSTVAALLGSFIDYYLGLRLGSRFLTGSSSLPWVNAGHLRRVQFWFDRYGGVAVALFRLVPAARVLISFPAGACRMSRRKFALFTLAGCLPWNITLVYLGWLLGSSWSKVVGAFGYINLFAYGLLVVIIFVLAFRLTKRNRDRSD